MNTQTATVNEITGMTCRLCSQQVTLRRQGQNWQIVPHKINSPASLYYCEALHEPGIESLTYQSQLDLQQIIGPLQPAAAPETTSIQGREEKPAQNGSESTGSGTKQPETEPLLTQATDSIQVRFEEFHAQNPKVLELLIGRCRELKQNGYKQYAMSALWEWMRWHQTLAISTTEPFKVSNDFRSRYARLIMDTEPDLQGFFELRHLTSK